MTTGPGPRKLNKRGWYVLISIASDDGDFCLDVFEHPDGGFGFQHFRSEAENQGGWTPVGGLALPGHDSASAAAAAAGETIRWLTTHPIAQATLADWQASVAEA